jgi:GntR family transcriptional repressor for pyruvate dehydrogenase complex
MKGDLVHLYVLAVRRACERMTPQHLKALNDSVEQACCIPAGLDWDRKATAHAEFVNLLADAAANPVFPLLLRNVPGQLHALMSAAGPAADAVIAASRRRLMARLRAGDADGAAREIEEHVTGLIQWPFGVQGKVDGNIAV